MGAIHAAFEVSRTVFAAVICLYFLGAQFKQVKTRERDATPFIWLLVAMLLVSGGEAAVAIVQAGGMPDIQPLAVTLLYILALLLQIDHLWPSTTEEKQPAWHAHLGSWTVMAVLDMLAIVEFAIVPHSSTFNPVCGTVAASLRCCLGLALFVIFAWPDRGGHIRLGDSIEDDTTTARSNLGNGGGGKRPESLALGQNVRDNIRAAGGPWLWAKRFRIFLPWIWPSNLPWIKLCVFASLLIRLGDMLLTLYTPYVKGAFVESVMQGYTDREPGLVWKPLALLMAVRLANSGTGLGSLQQLLWEKFKLSREERAKTRIYTHLMRHEALFHDAASPTDVLTATDLGKTVCDALDFIVLHIVPQIITFISAIITIFLLYGPNVALVQVSVIALNTQLILRSNRTLLPMYDAEIMAFQDTERQRQGGLRGWQTVSFYGQADREIKAYATSLSMQMGLMWKHYLADLGFRLGSNIIVNFGHFAATALVVLHGLRTGSTVGSVVAFSGYWSLSQSPLLFFTYLPGRVFRDLYAADRLRRILEIKPAMTYGTEYLRLTGGRVEFKNVTVSYARAGGEIFRGLNLVIESGKTTAFVGSSGVGKSTLLALSTRLYDPTEGIVMIDGQDIRTLKRGELPKHIAVMAQSPHLFNNTIMYNIRYGRPDATDSEVHDAAKSAGIHARIMSLPEQYDTVVAEGGGIFSGGETQRLALARVLLQRADILMFDEATSALDADTEAHIKESINTLCAGKTTVIIAHRLSSVKHADKIIVFEKGEDGFGEVVEEGNHSKLVEQGGTYARLWRKHIGAEEKDHQQMSIERLFDEEVEQ
ncbi:P-loop containing nucleoside triphosphate hydrolase protein [Aspergillus californicus]